MHPLNQLLITDSIAQAVLILSLVIALGLALGSIRVLGVHLGVAGVLFAGLIFGHYEITVDTEVLEFTREFGLILFVYTIGMQVGPGFFSSFKRDGLSLNLMAAFIVMMGVGMTILLSHFGNIPMAVAAGLFSGATTNTPSLAAVQQALKAIPTLTPEASKMPGLGYAVAYPFGILGIILTMILTRFIFRINPKKEEQEYDQLQAKRKVVLGAVDLKVENSNLDGLTIDQIPTLKETGVIISRVMHGSTVQVALSNTSIHLGDILHAVGPKERLEELKVIVGNKVDVDLREVKSNITARRVIVTKHEVVGKSIAELDVTNRYGVAITRVSRAEIEFPVTAALEFNFADTLVVVGEENAIKKFASDMGDSPRQLDHPQLIPIFVGIVLGVILGSWPIHLPGIPVTLKLGLAGGPLIVAIVLSRIGRIGNLIWYMPMSANFMLREFGIALFLACVGLRSGDQIVRILWQGNGLYWMAMAALITFVPIFIIAIFARLKYKMNYMSLCGLLAGSMTDPPALAFANNLTTTSAPAIAYSSVYPLVMLLRVISAQVLVVFFVRS